MHTIIKTSIHLMFALLIGLFVVEPANAKWKATAVWYITIYPSDYSVKAPYTGYGSTQNNALESARIACVKSQSLDQSKSQCTSNEPNELTLTEVGEAPPGSYRDSCSACRVEANLLVCDKCKPDSGRTALDLNLCTTPEQQMLENCHGRLVCGACPEDAKTPNPYRPGESCTKSGYCCSKSANGNKCKIPDSIKKNWKIETK